jgi:uncharacterized membrane protein YgaE (UPF0421/DUF939 family)
MSEQAAGGAVFQGSWKMSGLGRQALQQSARTAVAGTASLLAARAFALPETYWAAITTIVIMQSTLAATLTTSGERLVGSALGAAVGAALATRFGSNVYVFGAGLFVTGMICAIARIDRPAYRFAGMTLAIVMLIPRSQNPWMVGIHRFVEVAIGIAVGLVLTVLWPESTPPAKAPPLPRMESATSGK